MCASAEEARAAPRSFPDGTPVGAREPSVGPRRAVAGRDGLAASRVLFIQDRLDAGTVSARWWWYGWLGGYAAATLAQSAVAVATQDRELRATMLVGAGGSALGALGVVAMPFPPTDAASELRATEGLYAAVEAANRGLELRVAERTSALARRNGEMRLVLDTVSQGLVTIDRDGKMAGERSAAFDRWFGAPSPDSAFSAHVARSDPKLEASLRLGWAQLVDNLLPLQLCIEQIPRRMGVGETSYALQFTPLLDAEQVTGALVTISDVTAEEAAQRAETAEREFARAFERAVHDRAGFRGFLAEVGQLVRSVGEDRRAEVAEVLRSLHTIKGNCSVFGVTSVADVVHRLESTIHDDPRELGRVDFRPLDEAWARFTKRVTALVELKAENLVEVSHAEIDELAKTALAPIPRERVAAAVLALKDEPVAIRFQRCKQQIESLAPRLGKPIPTVIIEDDGLRLPTEPWTPFWSAFVHLLRNAVDHGLERPDDRKRAGKSEVGTIHLAAHAHEDTVIIEVRDDSRGIDWETVRRRAEHAGLATVDRAALVDALFADGFSTAAEVTPISGRGVGLAAVRHAVRGLLGHVEVASVTGQGTTFTFRFARRGDSRPANGGAEAADRARSSGIGSNCG